MLHCWLGEVNFDYPFETMGTLPKAIAVQINGNDHYLRDVIVFASKIGVEVNGAADYISGTHVWFPDNQVGTYPLPLLPPLSPTSQPPL